MTTTRGWAASAGSPPCWFAVRSPQSTLPEYAGIYRSGDSEIRISQRDGRLVADSALGRNEIRALSPIRFYFTNERGYLLFKKKAGGRATEIVVHRDGGDFTFERSQR